MSKTIAKFSALTRQQRDAAQQQLLVADATNATDQTRDRPQRPRDDVALPKGVKPLSHFKTAKGVAKAVRIS